GTIASFGSGEYLQCFTYALGFLSGSGFYLLRVAYKPSAPNAVNIARLYSVGTGGVTLLSTISDTINFTGGSGNYADLTGLSYDTDGNLVSIVSRNTLLNGAFNAHLPYAVKINKTNGAVMSGYPKIISPHVSEELTFYGVGD